VGSSDEYSRVIPFLSKQYYVIAMDYLGNGDSDPAPFAYQMLDHARTAVSFMDALGIKKANIVGKSVGSNVAAEVAINWPNRVNKLVLASPGYFPDPSEGIDMSNHPDFTSFTSRVDLKPDGSHLLEWWRRVVFWGGTLDILEDRVIEYIKAGPRGEEIHWASRNYDPKNRLPLIKCPTLVLSGTQDAFYAVAAKIKGFIPNGKLTVIENGSIYMSRIMPKEFAGAILNFLSALGK
jgi:pimeloyl-ACP methyl ester carboxylesterase